MRRKIKEKHDANLKNNAKKLFSRKQKRGKKYNVNARHFVQKTKEKLYRKKFKERRGDMKGKGWA